MNKPSIDWRYLAEDLLWPGVSLLVTLSVLVATMWFHSKQEKAYAQYSVNQVAIHDSYDDLVTRRKILERYHNRYDDYRESGFVGHENRLQWADTIRNAVERLDMPHVSYSLEPQLPVIAPVVNGNGDADMTIHVSRISLELGMVHELDLLRFFEQLAADVPGLMKIDNCKMSRLVDVRERTTIDANLSANCSMMLFSAITADIDTVAAGL